MKKETLISTILQCTAKFQQRFDNDSKPDVMKRYEILQSEIEETKKAISENNLVEILDGFCDQIYVLGGTIDKFEFYKEIQETYISQLHEVLEHAFKYFTLECIFDAFIEVHNSNMSKVHLSIFHVQETFKKYHLEVKNWRIKEVSPTEIMVYDNNINKLLKPHTYKIANLLPILEKYGYL